MLFEYQNKVIGYPSSIDVVLMNNNSIAFIESKFLEIVRDSTQIEKEKEAGRKVVGISYFNIHDNGYFRTLGLTKVDLDNIKISYPDDGPFLESVKGRSGEVQKIDKLDNNTFVYSEGIKQILSHIIGIQSFKNNESVYRDGEDPIANHNRFNKKIIYVELYNEFPGFEFAKKRIEDFEKHVNVVKKIIDDKGNLVDDFVVLTYQSLFKENEDFVISKNVSEYFRFK